MRGLQVSLPGHLGSSAAQWPKAQLGCFPLVLQVCKDVLSSAQDLFL